MPQGLGKHRPILERCNPLRRVTLARVAGRGRPERKTPQAIGEGMGPIRDDFPQQVAGLAGRVIALGFEDRRHAVRIVLLAQPAAQRRRPGRDLFTSHPPEHGQPDLSIRVGQ